MSDRPTVAIVDYGLGNLFSVKQACQHVGLDASIAATAAELLQADAIILPGVGAFGDAMTELHRRDLVAPLLDAGRSDKPLVGVCLGMQLLMSESFEFGRHRGLDLVAGEVVRFEARKVPHVGWAEIRPPTREPSSWADSLLDGLKEGAQMYFVHSFYVIPVEARLSLAVSRYGDVEFCASFRHENVFGCQFHPERSGVAGLRIYANLAASLRRRADHRGRVHA